MNRRLENAVGKRQAHEGATMAAERELRKAVSRLDNVETWGEAAAIAKMIKTLAGQLERAASKAEAAKVEWELATEASKE